MKYFLYILSTRFLWLYYYTFDLYTKFILYFSCIFWGIKVYDMLFLVYVLLCFQFTWWWQLLIPTPSGWTVMGTPVAARTLSGLCSFRSVGPGCLCLYLVPVVGLKPFPRKVLLSWCCCLLLLCPLPTPFGKMGYFHSPWFIQEKKDLHGKVNYTFTAEGRALWNIILKGSGSTLHHLVSLYRDTMPYNDMPRKLHVISCLPNQVSLGGTWLLHPVLARHSPKSQLWVSLIKKQLLSIRLKRNLFSETVLAGF